MEFGKVEPGELEKIDFTLPPDRPETTRVLQTLGGKHKPKVFVGCAKWGRKDWVGKIYPKGTKEADFLGQYAKRFNCIELNTTFYRMPTDASGRRDCVHMRLTTPEAFIRFVGNGLHPTDYTRIDYWVQRIKLWMGQGIEKVYLFMHQHEELHSPELSKYLIEQLNLHCGTSIQVPAFLESGELFDIPASPKKPGKKGVKKN